MFYKLIRQYGYLLSDKEINETITLLKQMVPRVIKINIGDIYTTNCLEKGNTSGKATVQGTEELSLGDVLSPNTQGYLSKSGDGSIRLEVVKIYTLPDGQQAVKVMRIA